MYSIFKIKFFKTRRLRRTRLLTKSRKDYLKNKEQARKLVIERVKYFKNIYNFDYNRISIRNQRTRWGSCSQKKNLNFNYKIIFLPKEAQDYLIIHEICHLLEFNHSNKFWQLVEKACPDYKKLRKQLQVFKFSEI